MNKQFLFEKYQALEDMGCLQTEVPDLITKNLKHTLRPYQEKAIKRFVHYHENYPNKNGNQHLLFEMATGTGKTLMMAALMLYLYSKNHRNFIFFVNSTNVLEKTKQNFIAQGTSKYLFTDSIEITGDKVEIKAIDSIEDSNPHCINILFTTIQGLHSQLNTPKENGLTLSDFTEYQVVLLADEAHHNNTQTKVQKELFDSWENSVLAIFQQHSDNHLLEFTATAELDKPALKDKYLEKAIIQYGLREFRSDGYSKNIFLAQTQTDEIKNRFLLALIVSQYRMEVAAKYKIPLKPVILFKSKTIKESRDNQKSFEEMIEHLTKEEIHELFDLIGRYRNQTPIYHKIYYFFREDEFFAQHLVERLKIEFLPEKIINANDDQDVKTMQIKLNTLEDVNNRYRVIFAVDKLNEGWDVLNLYDIVKLYETPSTKYHPPTTKEIQLIGRGARLYPYKRDDNQDLYKRKCDDDLDHESIVLEQLHFHTSDGSKFIEQLDKDLAEIGLKDSDLTEVEIKLKDDFTKSNIYKYGVIYLNQRKLRESSHMTLNKNLFGNYVLDDVFKKEFESVTGHYQIKVDLDEYELGEEQHSKNHLYTQKKTLKIQDIPKQIFLKACSRNKYFFFDNLEYKLGLNCITDLQKIFQDNLLTIEHPKTHSEAEVQKPEHLLKVCDSFLANLSHQMTKICTNYEGTKELIPKPIQDVFRNKRIILTKEQERNLLDGFQFQYLAQEKLKINSYEQQLIADICDFFQGKGLEPVWLMRNERFFQIYNFSNGEGFEPDFLLMLHQKDENENHLCYQIFVEPKGEHLQQFDQWKEDLMHNFEKIELKDTQQKIIALPFYTPDSQQSFLSDLNKKL